MGIDFEELKALNRNKKIEYLKETLRDDEDFFKKVILLMSMDDTDAENALTIISEYRAREWELILKLKSGERIQLKDYVVIEDDISREKNILDSDAEKEKRETQIEKIEKIQEEMESTDMVVVPEKKSFLGLLKKIKERFEK